MMTAICKNLSCPYNMNRGWCSNPLLSIDENGMCGSVWKRGVRINPPEPGIRIPIIIEEGEYREDGCECNTDSNTEGNTGNKGDVDKGQRNEQSDNEAGEYCGEHAGGD